MDVSKSESPASEAGPASGEADYPPPGQAWYCVSILALVVFVNFLDRGIVALLGPAIKADLHLSEVQTGLVLGLAFSVFYVFLGLPIARLVDRRSRKYILSVGIAIYSGMTAVCGLATNFWQLFLARVGVGVGETTSGPSAYSLLSDYFPPHKLPRAIAGMNLGFAAGSGLAFIAGGALIAAIGTMTTYALPYGFTLRGWQVVLVTVGIPGLIVSALMLTVKEPKRRGGGVRDEQPIFEVFQFLFHHWKVYIPLFGGLALRTIQLFGLQAWLTFFYGRTYGWSADMVGYIGGLSALFALPLGFYAGSRLSEYLWRKKIFDANVRVTVISTALAVPFGIMTPLMPSPWLAAGLGFFALLFGGMAAPVENAAVQSVTPNHLRGQMTFLFLFIMNVIGQGLGPLLVGAFTQYIFSEAEIRYSIVLSASIMGPPAAIIFWLGMKAYGRAMKGGGVLPSPLSTPEPN